MARGRDRPYAQFDFLIAPDDGTPGRAPVGGFKDCSNAGIEASVGEFRKARDRRAAAHVVGAFRGRGDATLKAGAMRSETLRAWLDEDAEAAATQSGRTVLVHLRDEHGPEAPLTWALRGARIIKHVSGPFNAKGTDVAIEELAIAYERLEMEV
jgi:phage tail-like protein